MDSYLRKLYGEASMLDSGGVVIEVWPGDDRDAVVSELDADWRTCTTIALDRDADGNHRWYDDRHFDQTADLGNSDEPRYYDTLQEAWNAIHGSVATCPTCGSDDPMVLDMECVHLAQLIGGRDLIDGFHHPDART